MMKLKLILFFSLISLISLAQSEELGITKTLNDYLEGGTNGNVTQFKNAFVTDAVQRSVSKAGGVTGLTVESLASKIKPGSVMNRTTKIVSWSYANDAATAITETVYPSSKIIDLLNLLKINGEWKIVSRVFSRIELNEEIVSSSSTSISSSPLPVSAAKSTKPAPKKKPVSDDGW